MRASAECDLRGYIDVYLNGKKLEDAYHADEEAGEAWVGYRRADGKLVPEIMAEPGAFIHKGLQVIKLKGKVEIKLNLPSRMSEEEARRLIEEDYKPFEVIRK